MNRAVIDAAVAGLVTCCHHENGASFINLPMIYPDGSSVTVRVTPTAAGFRVDDFGFAREVSDNHMDDAPDFAAEAAKVAAAECVQFSGSMFYLESDDAAHLQGMICAVAAASLKAAERMVEIDDIRDDSAMISAHTGQDSNSADVSVRSSVVE